MLASNFTEAQERELRKIASEEPPPHANNMKREWACNQATGRIPFEKSILDLGMRVWIMVTVLEVQAHLGAFQQANYLGNHNGYIFMQSGRDEICATHV